MSGIRRNRTAYDSACKHLINVTIHTSAFHFTAIENQVQIYSVNVGVKFNLQLTVHKVHRFNNSLKFSSNTTEVGGSNDR